MTNWTNKQIGKYKIKSLLGRGSMAEVYKAFHPDLEIDVALKLIRNDHLQFDEEATARFKREARNVVGLRHPNIVRLYDFDQEDDTFYIVMEFIEKTAQGDFIFWATFNPKDNKLTFINSNNALWQWDWFNEEADPQHVGGRFGLVSLIAFSPDGEILASAGSDYSIYLWSLTNLSSNTEITPHTLSGHDGSINTLAFSPDGQYLASGSPDQTIRVWIVSLDKLANLACNKIRRNLNQKEWERYLPGEPYHLTCNLQ